MKCTFRGQYSSTNNENSSLRDLYIRTLAAAAAKLAEGVAKKRMSESSRPLISRQRHKSFWLHYSARPNVLKHLLGIRSNFPSQTREMSESKSDLCDLTKMRGVFNSQFLQRFWLFKVGPSKSQN